MGTSGYGNNYVYKVIFDSIVRECLIPSSASVEEVVEHIRKKFRGVGEVKFMTTETLPSISSSSDLPRDQTGCRWVRVISDNNSARPERISRLFSTGANQSSKLVRFKIFQTEDIQMVVRPQDTVAEVVTAICESCQVSDIRKLSVGQTVVEGNIRTDDRKIFSVFGNDVTNINVDAANKLSIRICTPTEDEEDEALYEHYPTDDVKVLMDKIKENCHDPGFVNVLYESGYCCDNSPYFRTSDSLCTSSSSGIELSGGKESRFILPLLNDYAIHYQKNGMSGFVLKRKVRIYTVDNEGRFVVCNDVDIWKSRDYCVAVEGIEYHCSCSGTAQAEEVVRFFCRTKGYQTPDGGDSFFSKIRLSKHCASMFAVGHVTANYFYTFFKDGQCLPKTKGFPLALLIPYGFDSQFRIGGKRQVSCHVKSAVYKGYWLQGKDASKFRKKIPLRKGSIKVRR